MQVTKKNEKSGNSKVMSAKLAFATGGFDTNYFDFSRRIFNGERILKHGYLYWLESGEPGDEESKVPAFADLPRDSELLESEELKEAEAKNAKLWESNEALKEKVKELDEAILNARELGRLEAEIEFQRKRGDEFKEMLLAQIEIK